MLTELRWLKGMSKDESLIIKVQKGHINIKTSISPFLKNSGCYHFNAKRFQTFILLLTLWSDSSLWYILWVFSFNLGEGWGGIECLGRDKGVGKSMEGQSTEVACLTFTHLFSYWATAEHGWHWNTLSTVSQAVHVKNPGTRRHYSLNMTFYCAQFKTESCALRRVIICVTVMNTTNTVRKAISPEGVLFPPFPLLHNRDFEIFL